MIKEIALNNSQWNSKRKSVGKLVGMIEVSEVTTLAQVEALSRKIGNLSTQKLDVIMACDTCGGGHTSTNCLL